MKLSERDLPRIAGTVVVDEDGRPRRVYHGTCSAFHEFDPGFHEVGALYGPGFYFTEDARLASEYAEKGCQYDLAYPPDEVAAELRSRVTEYISQASRKSQEYRDYAKDAALNGNLRDELELLSESDRWSWKERQFRERLETIDEVFGEEFDIRSPRFAALIYWIQDAKIPVSDLVLMGHPNVHVAYLGIRRPFDMEQRLSAEEITNLVAEAESQGEETAARWLESEPPGPLDPQYPGVLNAHQAYQGILRGLQASGEHDALESRVIARRIIERAGYDGITHIGGRIMGTRDHRVWIAFHPDQIVPL